MRTVGGNTNPHVLPQHYVCPFCSYDFTVYARLEHNEEDMRYFLHRTGMR